jgi:CubicO group peptidase (beta-lactamase class C family)
MFDPWVTREITVRDVYAHRSGLAVHAGDLLEDLGFNALRDFTSPALSTSCEQHSFALRIYESGITEAGVAAAKAYGLDLEQASEEKLYRPLGMTSTSSRYVDSRGQCRSLAQQHDHTPAATAESFKRSVTSAACNALINSSRSPSITRSRLCSVRPTRWSVTRF